MAVSTIFQRGYLWALDNGETDIALFGEGDFNQGLRFADDMGWSFCIKVQDGQSERNQGLAGLIRQRRSQLGLRHFPILGWSTNRDQPEADADKTNGLIYREALDGFCQECEEYKGPVNSERWKRTKRFVQRALLIEGGNSILRRYMTDGAWGFVYLPNEPAGPYMDWASVSLARGRGIPECYPNEFPTEPSQWPHDAIQLASKDTNRLFPRSYMHPLVGAHKSKQTVPMRNYVATLKQSKADGYFSWGFAVYGIKDLTAQDRAVLKSVTKPAGTKDSNTLVWY